MSTASRCSLRWCRSRWHAIGAASVSVCPTMSTRRLRRAMAAGKERTGCAKDAATSPRRLGVRANVAQSAAYALRVHVASRLRRASTLLFRRAPPTPAAQPERLGPGERRAAARSCAPGCEDAARAESRRPPAFRRRRARAPAASPEQQPELAGHCARALARPTHRSLRACAAPPDNT
jgi:hypothetical protein